VAHIGCETKTKSCQPNKSVKPWLTVIWAVSSPTAMSRFGGVTHRARTWPVSSVLTKERLISRWERKHFVEAVQRQLDEPPEKMRQPRETVEHPFGTIKARMGATHFLTKTLPKVASKIALHVLVYNLTRMINIIGIQAHMAAIRA
jgi:hypothetical protein